MAPEPQPNHRSGLTTGPPVDSSAWAQAPPMLMDEAVTRYPPRIDRHECAGLEVGSYRINCSQRFFIRAFLGRAVSSSRSHSLALRRPL